MLGRNIFRPQPLPRRGCMLVAISASPWKKSPHIAVAVHAEMVVNLSPSMRHKRKKGMG